MEILLTDDREEEEVKKQIWFCEYCAMIFGNGGKELTLAEIAKFEEKYCKENGTHSIISRKVSINQRIAL